MGQTGKTLSIQSSLSEKSGFCQEEDANWLLGQTDLSLVGSCAGKRELKQRLRWTEKIPPRNGRMSSDNLTVTVCVTIMPSLQNMWSRMVTNLPSKGRLSLLSAIAAFKQKLEEWHFTL
jgi:hypothetical protein